MFQNAMELIQKPQSYNKEILYNFRCYLSYYNRFIKYCDCLVLSCLFQSDVLAMTLNCIWWRGSSFRDLGSVGYPFIYKTD